MKDQHSNFSRATLKEIKVTRLYKDQIEYATAYVCTRHRSRRDKAPAVSHIASSRSHATESSPSVICHCDPVSQIFIDWWRLIFFLFKLATFPPEGREHSPLQNGLGLTPAAAVRIARRHARPINA